MALIPRLDLRQSQTLVMTPQLQQAIKLLQLSNIELAEYVSQELERNPLLEQEGLERESFLSDPAQTALPAEPAEAPSLESGQIKAHGLETLNLGEAGDSPSRRESSLDVDCDNVWNNNSSTDAEETSGLSSPAFTEWGRSGGGRSFDDGVFNLEQTVWEERTLRERLISQISIEFDDSGERMIAFHLLDMLDDSGYVRDSLEDLASLLGCDFDDVDAVLGRLQGLDPPGIFARNLRECLAIQLRDLDQLDPAMVAFVDNLDLLAKRDILGLIRVCGVDAEDIAGMAAQIRALNPKPAAAFDHSVAPPVIPDVLMRPCRGGGWTVELNNETLPRVLINNHYFSQVGRAARDKSDKQYLNECFQSANWLVKSLHQRATTILKVATELVCQQNAFFIEGIRRLKPLVLRDIAEAVDMHESTVSRVTSNKYIATPRGIYELKYFFTPAVGGTSGGKAHSAKSIRYRIKNMIGGEQPESVFSDEKIVELLKAEGIDIARRTVAKYREAMGIPSSVQRRREKASGL